MATIEIKVPDIGDFSDVSVIELLVKAGDRIRAEQSLITVESDKAAMEIPSSHSGIVNEMKVALGDKLRQGSLILLLDVAEVTVAAEVAEVAVEVIVDSMPKQAAAPVQLASTAINPIADQMTVDLPHASPSVRKFARELGVPLNEVKGTGPKGRITDADVQTFTRSVMDGIAQTIPVTASPTVTTNDGAGLGLIPWPQVDFAKLGPIERKSLSRIKKISGANLLRNAVLIPAVTLHDDADITELEAFRLCVNKEQSGIKVTILAFLVKACVAALQKYPDFNSSIDGDTLIYKQYFNIGVAVDTPNGLMVPVIREADKKGILQISQEMAELAQKAREGKLSPSEMFGANFTISSLGGIGGRYFTPIINAPEVAILGVCRSTLSPVWNGTAFQPRLMLPVSLTWDHRVIDGAAAARFTVYLGQVLGDFRRVLL